MSVPIIPSMVQQLFNRGGVWEADDIKKALSDIPSSNEYSLVKLKVQVLHLLMLTDVILPKLEALEQPAKSKLKE